MAKDKNNNNEKALFIQRLLAFIIDMGLVLMLVSVLSIPFINDKKVTKLEKEQKQIVEKFQNKEISVNDYYIGYSNNYYKIARNTGFVSLITIIIEVLYFVVFQLYNKGQTFGKKLMKIRVKSEEGSLFMNQMIYRSLLSNYILVNIITFMLMIFSPKDIYILLSSIISVLQYILMFVSFLMISNRKCGYAIHDMLAHTIVVREN